MPTAFSLFLRVAALTALPVLAAAAEPPRVVADIPVTGSMVAAVMGDLGQPLTLAAGGQDAHDLQLKPSQAAALQDADLLVWIGPQMTGWLTRTAAARGRDQVLTLLEVPGTALQPYADGKGNDDHDHDGHGPEEDGVDPHAWLDPRNGAVWLPAIAEALAARDPDNAAAYRANAAAAAKELAELDARLAARLAPAKGRGFVVAHDAYGYYTRHYGLEPALAVADGGTAAPGAARLTELRAALDHSGATCAFPEASRDEGPLTTAIEGTTLRLGAALDPEGRALSLGADLYPAVLDSLATALADCLGGSGAVPD